MIFDTVPFAPEASPRQSPNESTSSNLLNTVKMCVALHIFSQCFLDHTNKRQADSKGGPQEDPRVPFQGGCRRGQEGLQPAKAQRD